MLSTDQQQDPAVLAINAASAALTASGVVWAGPVAAVRVVLRSEGEPPLVNPPLGTCVAPLLSLTVAGTVDRIFMLEAQVQLPSHIWTGFALGTHPWVACTL